MTLTTSCSYRIRAALILSVLVVLPFGAVQAEEIYRHVDDQGNVTYSDEPPEKDSKPMELAPLPEVSIPTPERPSSRRNTQEEDTEETQERERYKRVEIVEPEHDSAFWHGGGMVTIRARTEPRLSKGHSYQLEFDGERGDTNRSGRFSLNNVNRGTHTVVVHVLDSSGQVITSSDTTRFTLHRPSRLN
jgi:hypothetical protein